MSKSLKFIILTIFMLILLLFSNTVFATEVNLDTPNTTETTNTVDSNTPSTTENVETPSIDQTPTENLTSEHEEPEINDTTTAPSNENSGVSVTSTGSLPEETLGLTNILNIFLIVLGVLLLFLGFAILSQVKKS